MCGCVLKYVLAFRILRRALQYVRRGLLVEKKKKKNYEKRFYNIILQPGFPNYNKTKFIKILTRIASRAGSDCIVFWGPLFFFFIVFFQSFFGRAFNFF